MSDASYQPKVYRKQGGDVQVIADGGNQNIESGGTQTFETGGNFAHGGVRHISGTNPLPKTVKVALAAADTGGGVLSVANPEGVALLVTRLVLNVTTKSTAACTVDAGIAADGTTLNDGLIDGVDVGTAAGVFDNAVNGGTNGKGAAVWGVSEYVTASKASGAAAGLVGYAYITYVVA